MGNIIQMQQKRPNQSLRALNRLTGLDFSRWPQSLLTNGPVHGGPVAGGTGAATLSPGTRRDTSGPGQ